MRAVQSTKRNHAWSTQFGNNIAFFDEIKAIENANHMIPKFWKRCTKRQKETIYTNYIALQLES